MIKMKYLLIIPFLFLFLIPGCNTSRNRIEESRLTEIAILEGNRIAMETQQLLGSTLKSTIQERGIPAALDYCNLNAYPLVDSIQEKYDVSIKRASMATRNPQDAPDHEEMKIIDTYLEAFREGNTPEVFVNISQKEIHFAKPILLNDAVCLNCHGQVGTDISDENYRVIQALYPEDQATGHKLGDLRGIWSIKFKRQDLEKKANSMNE